MKPNGQRLDGDNLQEVLDAGANASKVGRQQFFTPPAIAAALMLALPKRQASFVDLTMGNGALMSASSAPDVFGIDIDSRLARKPDKAPGAWHCINADLTKLYPLLEEVGWQFDLCGLNPPFSVKWHMERLSALGESKCEAVAETFKLQAPSSKLQGSSKLQTIDSTLATLLIALDRMTMRGEGFLICNNAAAERFANLPIFRHVWAWLTIHDQSEARKSSVFGKNVRAFDVAVLYFARSHDGNEPFRLTLTGEADPGFMASRLATVLSPIATQRALLRKGFSVHNIHDCTTSTAQWKAVAEEVRSQKAEVRDWNIWLNASGTIRRHLTPFQQFSATIPRDKIEALNRLEGQSPMALVVQRASRIELLKAVHSPIWRVQPELSAAVEQAVAQYASHRAPFYKLNEVQRLGYLDEEDTIMCKKDFRTSEVGSQKSEVSKRNPTVDRRPPPTAEVACFKAGNFYSITSETISVERKDERPNILGKMESVTLSGKELCFKVKDDHKKTHAFSPGGERPPDNIRRPQTNEIWHSLEELITHFRIPEVPDVAEVNPVQFDEYVRRIREIETAMNIHDRAA